MFDVKYSIKVLCLYCLQFFSCVQCESFIYGGLQTDVTLNCPFRISDGNSLLWYGPPHNDGTATTYITSNDGANPNTALGNRLRVVGNHTAGEYNMKISNLQQSDEGKYSCEYRSKYTYFNLLIKDKPSNIRIFPVFDPYIVYVTQTGVQLQCTADVGNPHSITYTWSHNNVDTSNNPYVITVGKNSGGNYTCTASNTAGTITTSKVVIVQYGPEIQRFTKQQPVEGSRFVLSCYVSGKPVPTSQQIWWTRQNDNTYRRQGNKYVIDNIQKEQSGTYTCHAQNTLTPSGQSSINKTETQDVEVDVLYGPTIDPVAPQKFIAGRYASVSCNVSSYPVADITWTGPNNFHQTGQLLIFNKTTKSHKDKPEIMDIPSPSIVERENLTLTCSTRANPTAHSYKWTKIGDYTFEQLSETLVIADIRRAQSGKYKCTAMNTMSPTNGQTVKGKGHGEVTVSVKCEYLCYYVID
ncbi:hypothetical protein KUTeg_014711 [Tegillarca granosa]|uniref:Ig-like domain-containing protein n=1 Tax=Tegillarca granosa TaxID=220873 RepID=A0ABQ9EWK2_TEGGR|nr:hypothetical protein KUTeg_014711 [Tegillarca granosa]